MTSDIDIAAIAVEIADSIIADARESVEPVVFVTGNAYMPPLRSFGAAESVWQDAANDDGELFQYLIELVEARLASANVLLDVPEYDNALYAVDLGRWQYAEDATGDSLQDEWIAVASESELDEFVTGYVDTALWSSSIEESFATFVNERDGEDWAPDQSMLDYGFTRDDITEEAMARIREDCASFLTANLSDIREYAERMGEWHGSDSVRGLDARYSGLERASEDFWRAGEDFWLTRNGHGAGFFDRDLGKLGDRLQDAARVYGEAYLMACDDETIDYHG